MVFLPLFVPKVSSVWPPSREIKLPVIAPRGGLAVGRCAGSWLPPRGVEAEHARPQGRETDPDEALGDDVGAVVFRADLAEVPCGYATPRPMCTKF